MQPLFSYKPTAYIYVLPGSYKVAVSIHTFRTEQQGFKEGDFKRGKLKGVLRRLSDEINNPDTHRPP